MQDSMTGTIAGIMSMGLIIDPIAMQVEVAEATNKIGAVVEVLDATTTIVIITTMVVEVITTKIMTITNKHQANRVT